MMTFMSNQILQELLKAIAQQREVLDRLESIVHRIANDQIEVRMRWHLDTGYLPLKTEEDK